MALKVTFLYTENKRNFYQRHMFFFQYDRRTPPASAGIDAASLIHRLAPYAEPDQSGTLEQGPVQIVQCRNWNSAISRRERSPWHDPATGITLAAWARIDNRDELGEKLGISSRERDSLTGSELIVRAYGKWAEECVGHLVGDFVFALHDPKERKVFCGRDHLGVRPLYYRLSPPRFICATTLSAFLDLPGLAAEIDQQWLVDYLLRLSMSFDRTPYRDILKLPPAHTLTVDAHGHRLRQYFSLAQEPPLLLQDPGEYVEAYRERLEEAMSCRVGTDYPLGSELSGGLDSSTVTAYAYRLGKQPSSRFHAFAFATSELEPQYILAVSRALGLPQTHILSPPGDRGTGLAERAGQILGCPVEHESSTFHEPFYRLAAALGIRTLLSGFGGDEFATTIHGNLVPLELITSRRYRELYQRLEGTGIERLLRFLKLGLRQVLTRNFTRPEYNPRFFEAFQRRWQHQIVRQEWVARFDLKKRYLDKARFDAGYTDLKKFTLEKRWQPFIPTRLENCTLMAAARKIEYRWPLLDVRLVRLFFSIPSVEQFHQGMGRYLHRRAIAGVVPDLVTWKRSKYMGPLVRSALLPFIDPAALSVEALHPRLLELIDADRLRQRLDLCPQAGGNGLHPWQLELVRDLRALGNLDSWLKQRFPVSSGPQSEASRPNLEA